MARCVLLICCWDTCCCYSPYVAYFTHQVCVLWFIIHSPDGAAGGRQSATTGDHQQVTRHNELSDGEVGGGASKQDAVGGDTAREVERTEWLRWSQTRTHVSHSILLFPVPFIFISVFFCQLPWRFLFHFYSNFNKKKLLLKICCGVQWSVWIIVHHHHHHHHHQCMLQVCGPMWQGDEVPRVLQHVHWLRVRPVFIWWVWQGQDARDIATGEEQSIADREHAAQSHKQRPQQWVLDCFILLQLWVDIHEQLLPREHVPKTFCPWLNLHPGRLIPRTNCTSYQVVPMLCLKIRNVI